MALDNTYIAEHAETVTKGAGIAGAISYLLEVGHSFLGWAFSGQGLATLSVIIAITSSLVGIYFRKRDHQIAVEKAKREEELAHRKELRELELHAAKLAALKARKEEAYEQSC